MNAAGSASAAAAAGGRFEIQTPKSIRALRKTWELYRQADLGLRNHWYPICWAYELADGKPLAQKVLGEPIIVRRVDGKVYALEDRCLHRRVPLSYRFECFTKDTVTCWYHGFTYDWKTGVLRTILTDPACELIGKMAVKTYRIEEAQGLVFVFIGDIEPPPLADDVPLGFLDANRVAHGRRIKVDSNWRWACENGLDSTHVYIHRNSRIAGALDGIYPMGIAAKPDHAKLLDIRTGDGPKGLLDSLSENYEPIWSGDIGEATEVTSAQLKFGEELDLVIPSVGIWMPCGVSVFDFPKRGMSAYEFYVPIDKKSHMYFQISTKDDCPDPKEAAVFRRLVDDFWGPLVFDEFNGDDVMAREGLEDGYTNGDGWQQEYLTPNDIPVIAWRQLVSRYARGVQQIGSNGPRDGAGATAP